MWEINLKQQLISFCYSLILGILLCILYDLFKAIRINMKLKFICIFISDVLYFIISAFLTFLILLALTNGEIRAFILIGELLGFILCRISISKISYLIFSLIIKAIYKVKKTIYNCFYGAYDIVIDFFILLFNKIYIFLKIALKNIKKLLKYLYGMLYTKLTTDNQNKGV